ncbi:protein 5NUC-like [Dermacentor silvarum]|uniref:protein 5NUC-like n=1 Tax=Dermacentor silvarum TaxID=543639 RepID=UPI002100A298|nr:protein 5NUC-like [Dermacentor silvarum]
MSYTVEGEEIDPAELRDGTWQHPKCPADPLDLQKRFGRKKTDPTKLTEELGLAGASAASKNKSRPPQLPRRKPMPRLPEEDYKIVLRPKCAVNLTNIGLIALLEAIYATSKINQAQAEQADQNKKTTSQSDTQTTGETRRSHSRGRTQGVFRDPSESFPPLHSRDIDQSTSGGNTSQQQDEPAKHVAWGSGKPNLRDKTTPQVTTSLETPPEQQSRNGRTTTQTREERSGYKISQAAREEGTPTRPQQSKPQQQQDQQCLGNHEFDDGPGNLAAFLKKMNESGVTMVGSNTNFSKEPLLAQYDLVKSAIKEIQGTKIGILGAVIPGSRGPTIQFYDEITSLQEEADKLVKENVSIIIAITHSGFPREIDIAQNISAIDILVGGHTNTFLYTGNDHPKENKPEGPYPYVVNRTDGSRALVVQDFCFGKFLGRLDVTFDSAGHIVSWGGNPILLNVSVDEDKCITDILEPFTKNFTERMTEVLGSTRVLMEHKHDICRMQECNLGNLIADAYYEYYLKEDTAQPPIWSDLNGAVVNAGSIRTALPSFYNVTWGDVVNTLPYGNSLLTIRLTGTDIWNMFENSVAKYNTVRDKQKGRFLQVSGFRVEYDLRKNSGERVTSVSIICANCSVPKYQPIDCEATYKIVAADYVAKGGDGFKFSDSAILSDVGPIEYEALEQYIVKMSPMKTPNEGRIKITWNETDAKAVLNYTQSVRENQICTQGDCRMQ